MKLSQLVQATKQAIVFYLLLLFIYDANASPTPTLNVKCIPETFHENVAMTNHSCTVCLSKEGSAFFQCKSVCNCTVINSGISQSSVSTAARVPTAATKNSETQVSSTAIKLTALVRVNTTSLGVFDHVQPTLATSNKKLIIVTIIPVSAVVVTVLLSLAIFRYRKNRQGGNTTEGCDQGCFSRRPATTPIPCSDNGPSSGDPESPEHAC